MFSDNVHLSAPVNSASNMCLIQMIDLWRAYNIVYKRLLGFCPTPHPFKIRQIHQIRLAYCQSKWSDITTASMFHKMPIDTFT